MPYTLHEFKSNDTLYASQLNEMDQGIKTAVDNMPFTIVADTISYPQGNSITLQGYTLHAISNMGMPSDTKNLKGTFNTTRGGNLPISKYCSTVLEMTQYLNIADSLNIIIVPGMYLQLPATTDIVVLIGQTNVTDPLMLIVREEFTFTDTQLNTSVTVPVGMYGINRNWIQFHYRYIDIDEKYSSLFESTNKIHVMQLQTNSDNMAEAITSIPFHLFKSGDIILGVTPLTDLLNDMTS